MGKSLIIKNANFAVNGIPPEFQRLSWIGVTTKDNRDDGAPHGQYINSGVYMTINTKLVVECTLDDVAHSVMSPGCGLSINTNLLIWVQSSRIVAQMALGNGSSANELFISGNFWDGKKHVFEISKASVVIDGTTHSWEYTPSNSGQVGPIYLDCSSRVDNSSGYANSSSYVWENDAKTYLPSVFKIHNVKIYSDYTDESSLVMDAIPVKRLSDNVVCFYNAVTGEYHERNNGSTPEYGV